MPTLTVNGHQVSVDDSFLKLSPDEQNATVDEIAKSLPTSQPAAAPASPPSSGVIAGAEQGLSHALSGPAETLKDFAGVDTSGAQAVAKSIAPTNYKPAELVPDGGHWYNPASWNWSQIPQYAAENAPSAVEAIAAARLAARIHPLLGAAAGAGVMALNSLGDNAKQAAITRTGDQNAEPNAADKTRAVATQALQTIPQMIQVGRFLPGAVATKGIGASGVATAIKKAATTAGVEGAANAASNVGGQVGQTLGTDKGLTIDPNQVSNAAVGGAVGGSILAAPRTITNVANANRFSKFGGDNAAASENLANKISQAADGANLGNTGNGFDAVRNTSQDLVRDLRSSIVAHQKAAKQGDVEPIDQGTMNVLERVKKLQPLTDSDLAQVDANTSPQVADLARQAHVASLLQDMGNYGSDKFSGGTAAGLGGRIRAMAPRTTTAGLVAALGITHGSDLIAASPAVLAAMGGGYLGLRALDKLTGARSPAKGFVDQFGSDTPIPSSVVPPPAPPQAPTVSPTGPKVPFNPGVAGGAPQAPAAPVPAPAAPQMPSPPMAPQMPPGGLAAQALAKVQASQQAQQAAYTPRPESELWRKGLGDEDVANRELSSYEPAVRQKYAKNVIANRGTKRDLMEGLANSASNDNDGTLMGALYHQLDHISRRAEARQAIAHFTAQMSPEGAHAVQSNLAPLMGKLWTAE